MWPWSIKMTRSATVSRAHRDYHQHGHSLLCWLRQLTCKTSWFCHLPGQKLPCRQLKELPGVSRQTEQLPRASFGRQKVLMDEESFSSPQFWHQQFFCPQSLILWALLHYQRSQGYIFKTVMCLGISHSSKKPYQCLLARHSSDQITWSWRNTSPPWISSSQQWREAA